MSWTFRQVKFAGVLDRQPPMRLIPLAFFSALLLLSTACSVGTVTASSGLEPGISSTPLGSGRDVSSPEPRTIAHERAIAERHEAHATPRAFARELDCRRCSGR